MGAGTITLLVVVGFALLCAAVVGVVQLTGNGPDDDASEEVVGFGDATTVPEVTVPRQEVMGNLATYCQDPGQAWAEVPGHIPGQPSRLWLDVDEDLALTNGTYGQVVAQEREGSTVISPATDGKVTLDQSVLTRTRAVACIRFLRTEGLGRSCDYGQWAFQQAADFSLELAQNRYEVVVYELHNGGILHKGEILSPAPYCPDSATDDGTSMVASALRQREVLDWVSSHFVGGKPA